MIKVFNVDEECNPGWRKRLLGWRRGDFAVVVPLPYDPPGWYYALPPLGCLAVVLAIGTICAVCAWLLR